MMTIRFIRQDIKILVDHLEARGVVIDELLWRHLLKIDSQLPEREDFRKGFVTNNLGSCGKALSSCAKDNIIPKKQGGE